MRVLRSALNKNLAVVLPDVIDEMSLGFHELFESKIKNEGMSDNGRYASHRQRCRQAGRGFPEDGVERLFVPGNELPKFWEGEEVLSKPIKIRNESADEMAVEA